jgi:putative MATE family efflux protein
MQVVNTLLDRGFIGHLESSALTAHGGATNVMFLMFSLAMAVGTAATALVARAYGARDDREYRMASRQSLRLAMVGGVFFCAVCALIAPAAATFVLPADDPAAIRQMVAFVRAYAIGMPAIYLIQTLAGSLRGIGDTKSPMWISGIQILLHITLNFFLIRRFGLVGAAMSLSTSAWLAAIAYLIYQQRTPLGASSLFALPSRDWIQRILRIAAPAAAMAALRVFSLTAFTLILKGVPSASAAIAAMSVGFAIESIMFMPAFGLSMAAGALVGQNLGAKNPARAERLAWVAGHHGAIVTAFVAIPIFLLAHPIAFGLVGGKAVIANNAADLIRALCVTEVLFAYAMIMIGAMQGAGDTKGPMWISIIALWGLRVPLAWIFAIGMKMGAPGAWLSMSATQGVQGIMSIWLFQRGAWKTKRV